ncbi:hypothetical protein, partial [Streptomyces antibioticus]|uniref:hypothetical protein n=1 Tax=Streptomyces antibioticus TaxID=1890 RepID=UPI00349625ED
SASRCLNLDGSRDTQTDTASKGASITGGAANFFMEALNTAQSGRQNNACAQGNNPDLTLSTSKDTSDCVNDDGSRNHRSHSRSGGARITGGTGSDLQALNTAQSGRQNNACAKENEIELELGPGFRRESHCVNRDHSHNERTDTEDRGARITGGSSTRNLQALNTAQSGRQNNACAQYNSFTPGGDRTNSRQASECVNDDHSHSRATRVRSDGASSTGGSGTAEFLESNVAQSGRQNNSCAQFTDADAFGLTGGSSHRSRCANRDHSHSAHTDTATRGAHTVAGGSGGGFVALDQQNTAQAGRQNNSCSQSIGDDPDLLLDSSSYSSGCVNVDHSHDRHTRSRSGGARAEGGSG